MSLVEERQGWHKEFSEGGKPWLLKQYEREVRNSELERFSKAVESLCEYALWLEERMKA